MKHVILIALALLLCSCGLIPHSAVQSGDDCHSIARYHNDEHDHSQHQCEVVEEDDDDTDPTPTPTPPPGAKTVEFRIVSGTGDGAWNLATNPVQVKVGDTLRVYNDDSTGVGKQIHTGGKPFAHANSAIPVGGFRDYVILQAANPTADIVYNHLVGTAARFYIVATP